MWHVSIDCCVLSSLPLLSLLPWKIPALVALFRTVPWRVVLCLSDISIKLQDLGSRTFRVRLNADGGLVPSGLDVDRESQRMISRRRSLA